MADEGATGWNSIGEPFEGFRPLDRYGETATEILRKIIKNCPIRPDSGVIWVSPNLQAILVTEAEISYIKDVQRDG